MKISKATQAANKLGKGMIRKSCPDVVIFPTNSQYCCLMAIGKDKVIPRWEPSYDDLVATDWYALGSFK